MAAPAPICLTLGKGLTMTGLANDQASLEAVLKDEIIRMYQEVADSPESTFHCFHGREAAELFGYAPTGSTAHH